jgi:hypothetical protein
VGRSTFFGEKNVYCRSPPRVCHVGIACLYAFLVAFKKELDFPRAAEYFRMLIMCCSRGKSLSGYYRKYGELAPDAFFVHMSRYDQERVVALCNRFFRMSFERLRKTGWCPGKVVVAIDCNDEEHWGARDDHTLKTIGKKRVGSSKVYRFATVAIVDRGFKFTLGCIPVTGDDRPEETVRVLLEIARGMVDVDLVLMDRGYYNVDVLNMIEAMGLDYLVHVKKCPSTRRLFLESKNLGTWQASYTVNRTIRKRRKTIRLFFKEHPKYEYMVLTSNKPVNDKEVFLFFETYRKRWGIENSYREKNEFKIKTSTTRHALRCLLYGLSHLFVNLLQIIIEANKTVMTKDEMKDLLPDLVYGLHGTRTLAIDLQAIP